MSIAYRRRKKSIRRMKRVCEANWLTVEAMKAACDFGHLPKRRLVAAKNVAIEQLYAEADAAAAKLKPAGRSLIQKIVEIITGKQ